MAAHRSKFQQRLEMTWTSIKLSQWSARETKTTHMYLHLWAKTNHIHRNLIIVVQRELLDLHEPYLPNWTMKDGKLPNSLFQPFLMSISIRGWERFFAKEDATPSTILLSRHLQWENIKEPSDHCNDANYSGTESPVSGGITERHTFLE